MDDAERIRELEIKLTFLEKHVQEQDSVVYAQEKRIATLEKAARDLYARTAEGSPEDAPANEKPPHY